MTLLSFQPANPEGHPRRNEDKPREKMFLKQQDPIGFYQRRSLNTPPVLAQLHNIGGAPSRAMTLRTMVWKAALRADPVSRGATVGASLRRWVHSLPTISDFT